MDLFEKFSPRVTIATSSWYKKLDPNIFSRIGISRGVPRGMPRGYKGYTKLNPGPWFNSVTPELFRELYFEEILKPLDPSQVVAELQAIADGKIPTLLCFEPPTPGEKWCHRELVGVAEGQAQSRRIRGRPGS